MQRYKFISHYFYSNLYYLQFSVLFILILSFSYAVGIEEEAVPCASQYHTGTTADTWEWVNKLILAALFCIFCSFKCPVISLTWNKTCVLSFISLLDDEKSDDDNNQESLAENGEWACRDLEMKWTDFKWIFCPKTLYMYFWINLTCPCLPCCCSFTKLTDF